jgi:hypothetical protein
MKYSASLRSLAIDLRVAPTVCAGAKLVGIWVDSAWCHIAFTKDRNLHRGYDPDSLLEAIREAV